MNELRFEYNFISGDNIVTLQAGFIGVGLDQCQILRTGHDINTDM